MSISSPPRMRLRTGSRRSPIASCSGSTRMIGQGRRNFRASTCIPAARTRSRSFGRTAGSAIRATRRESLILPRTATTTQWMRCGTRYSRGIRRRSAFCRARLGDDRRSRSPQGVVGIFLVFSQSRRWPGRVLLRHGLPRQALEAAKPAAAPRHNRRMGAVRWRWALQGLPAALSDASERPSHISFYFIDACPSDKDDHV